MTVEDLVAGMLREEGGFFVPRAVLRAPKQQFI